MRHTQTFKSINEAEGKAICQAIWLQLEQLDVDDAWSIIAIVMMRFVDETGEFSRHAFTKWLEYTKPKTNGGTK